MAISRTSVSRMFAAVPRRSRSRASRSPRASTRPGRERPRDRRGPSRQPLRQAPTELTRRAVSAQRRNGRVWRRVVVARRRAAAGAARSALRDRVPRPHARREVARRRRPAPGGASRESSRSRRAGSRRCRTRSRAGVVFDERRREAEVELPRSHAERERGDEMAELVDEHEEAEPEDRNEKLTQPPAFALRRAVPPVGGDRARRGLQAATPSTCPSVSSTVAAMSRKRCARPGRPRQRPRSPRCTRTG